MTIGGTEIWRQVIVPEDTSLRRLHKIIQIVFGWKDSQPHLFKTDAPLDETTAIKFIADSGITEILYEYGAKWNIKILFLSRYENDEGKPIRCVAGEGASPPEEVEGPLRFRRVLSALEAGSDEEKKGAENELGDGFNTGALDFEAVNKILRGER
jgi:hypothetical protein